jgi:M6 family metalloprotease-like protein
MKICKRIFVFLLCFTIFISFSVAVKPPTTVKSAPRQIKLLPLLLNFSDVSHQRVVSEIHDFFFSTKPEDRSLRNYFLEVTNGSVEFVPGSYDVGDWIKMPKSKKEYARTDSVSNLLRDAFDILTSQGLDFNEYDQNNDGYIDYTIIVQSGDPVEGYGGSIFWLHYAPYKLGTYVSEGLAVGEYNMTAEKFKGDKTAPLQGICHEFYHYQGGWDLYSYTGRDGSVGPWCIMAEDRWSNFGLNGFSRAFLGWVRPIEITKSGVYEINALATNEPKRLYKVDIPGTQEYFLIENRQSVGIDSWWQGLPSTGLIFTHVDGGIPPSFQFNDGPTKYPHYAVWVEDGGGVKEKKDAVYCANKNRPKFTTLTNPNTWDYNKEAKVGVNFTQISNSDMKMTFRVDFVYQEPHAAVDLDILDFGKIQPGIDKEIAITINNEGTGKISGRMYSKDNWISFEPADFSGNGAIVKVIASANFIKTGNYKGKIDIKVKGGETLSIPTKVQVVEFLCDVNGDGKVDQTDIKLFYQSYGTKKGDEKFDPDCDFNTDDKIDLLDLLILAKNIK